MYKNQIPAEYFARRFQWFQTARKSEMHNEENQVDAPQTSLREPDLGGDARQKCTNKSKIGEAVPR